MLPSLFSIFVLFMKHLFELFSRSQNQIPKSILIAGFAGIFSMENSIYFFLGTCSIYSCRESNDWASNKSSIVGILDMTLSPIVVVLWKITLTERKLILEIQPFSTDP